MAKMSHAFSDFDARLKQQLSARDKRQEAQDLKPISLREPHRDLQQATYRANYAGRFQLLMDSGCLSPSPVLRVICRGTVQVVGTSDPSIVCAQTSQENEFGLNYIECTNTCSGNTACSDVYLALNINADEGPFAEIQFQCSGDDLTDVDARFEFVDSGDGTCLADGRNFHVARLGVSCPNVAGTGPRI